MRIRIWPYKQGSASAKALSEALGAKVLKLEGSKYVRRPDDLIINWGSSTCPFDGCVNDPASVARGGNKLLAFQKLEEDEVSIPRFWTDREGIPDDAFPVVCRTVLQGHSGRGIVIADTRDDLVDAPLYTEYVKKKDEYRVHILRGKVICTQRKARRVETPDELVNWRVRNHSNGFVFQRNEVVAPVSTTQQALRAMGSLGLDFGGVDVIYNERYDRSYVLEVNSACGLEGSTVDDYVTAFKEEFNL